MNKKIVIVISIVLIFFSHSIQELNANNKKSGIHKKNIFTTTSIIRDALEVGIRSIETEESKEYDMINYQKSVEGRISEEEKGKIVDEIVNNVEGCIVDKIIINNNTCGQSSKNTKSNEHTEKNFLQQNTKDIYYGYTDFIGKSIENSGKKINFNIVITYNEECKRTYICMASPILNIDF